MAPVSSGQSGLQPVRPPGRSDRTAHRLVLAAAVVLLLAVVKPWSFGQAETPAVGGRELSSGPPRAGTTAADASAPTPSPTPAGGPDRVPCFRPRDWQLVTVERVGGKVIRTWYVADVAPSILGEDPPVATPLQVIAGDLVAIGVCAPASQAVAPGVSLLGAWNATAAGRPGSPLSRLLLLDDPAPDVAVLYGFPASDGTRDGLWPSGRYVLEASDPRLNPDRVIWMSVTVRRAPQPVP